MMRMKRAWGLDLVPELLAGLGYDTPARGAIMLYLIDNGTTEGCDEFCSEEDRIRVEDMLPDADESEWNAMDALVPQLRESEFLMLTY